MCCHCFTSTTIAKQKTLGLNYPTKKCVLILNEENYTEGILDPTTPFQFIIVSVMVRRLNYCVLCIYMTAWNVQRLHYTTVSIHLAPIQYLLLTSNAQQIFLSVSNFLNMAVSLKLQKVIIIEIFWKIFLTWILVESRVCYVRVVFSPLSLSSTREKSLYRLIESKS